MGIMKMYRPKNTNERKLDVFIDKLEKQGIFKEEVKNDNVKVRHIPGKSTGSGI